MPILYACHFAATLRHSLMMLRCCFQPSFFADAITFLRCRHAAAIADVACYFHVFAMPLRHAVFHAAYADAMLMLC